MDMLKLARLGYRVTTTSSHTGHVGIGSLVREARAPKGDNLGSFRSPPEAWRACQAHYEAVLTEPAAPAEAEGQDVAVRMAKLGYHIVIAGGIAGVLVAEARTPQGGIIATFTNPKDAWAVCLTHYEAVQPKPPAPPAPVELTREEIEAVLSALPPMSYPIIEVRRKLRHALSGRTA